MVSLKVSLTNISLSLLDIGGTNMQSTISQIFEEIIFDFTHKYCV
jgi:hypothetical protein